MLTFWLQAASPLFHVVSPLSGPDQRNVISTTLKKLLPVAVSSASYVDWEVTISVGFRSVKVKRGPEGALMVSVKVPSRVMFPAVPLILMV
jgi:hypothetical protein